MRINSFFTGYALIDIEGSDIEMLVNKALWEDITIKALESNGISHQAKVNLADLPKLRRLARDTDIFFTVSQIGGLPKVLRSCYNYRVPGAVFVLSLFFLIFCCQCIAGVKIESESPLTSAERGEILSIAEDYGISPGIWRRNIDWDAAAGAIMAEYPGFAWVGFDRDGVIMKVKIVAKAEKDDSLALKGDLVAAKDGIVRSLLVFQGQARVAPETPVKKGDVLIGGEVFYLDEEGNSTAEPSLVQAKGLVEASVWYSGEAEIPLNYVESVTTGRLCRLCILQWQGKDYVIWGDKSDFEIAETESQEINISQSLSLKTYTIKELEKAKVELTPDEALSKAKKQAAFIAGSQVPATAEIVAKETEILADGTDGYAKVKVTIEVRENIGIFQSFTGIF